MKLIELLLREGITANLFAPSACGLQSLGVEKHCATQWNRLVFCAVRDPLRVSLSNVLSLIELNPIMLKTLVFETTSMIALTSANFEPDFESTANCYPISECCGVIAKT